ncbi:glucokinase [Mycoplasmopsis pullorum]|uniref:ROK family protein n=1 Tax=Mycoplasmopsis pullorum TaxID=48003 RepID=UPI00111B3B1D|nr:ROK family protein [Mycoplasmopsis pullorum]TNK82260.1 glucokinase [Mycoplasmopsis pullorum]TNK83157.1 glucokinase [Mycoplasmopsis pullorum]TNK83750.1 glucokinase [Mycoplasmopsis pullorum]TNK85217.1 glucokinase [Mycoplasmopsis pullorum]TNK85712.1 glucokinase [Mycoplasmopsis pullorum]
MNSEKYAVVDIGGTNTRFALVKDLKVIHKERFNTDANDPIKTLSNLVKLIEKHGITSLALCIPGPADYDNGIVLHSPNLAGWSNFNVKKFLLENTKINKIVFENDANAMALANHYRFKQSDKDITQFFTVSTGFGAGLVINNQIFSGFNHLGQEIAYIPLGDKKEFGLHLPALSAELFVGGNGIVKRYEYYSQQKKTTKEIFDLAENNDPLAQQIINEGIDVLAKTIATTLAFINPSVIAFGGSISLKNKSFVQKAIQKAAEYTEENQYKSVRFVFDEHGDDSALIGLDLLIKQI